MATINLGSIKFNWKGAFNNSTAYAVDDVVSSGGNSYVCIQASTGNAVGNATAYWNIMSAAGSNGTDGTDLSSLLSTRGDLVFKNASALARLAKGTEGQVLGQGANDPAWVNGSAKTLTTQGDLLYRDGSGLQRLAKGTAAQELRMNSAANAPEWHTPASSGTDCLQVYCSQGGTVTPGSNTQWTAYSTPSKNDFGSAWNSTNGTFTIPTTGSYFMSHISGFGHGGNSTRYHQSKVFVDGSQLSMANGDISSSTARITSNGIMDSGYDIAQGILTLNANQVVTFYIYLQDESASGDPHKNGARLTIMKM